MVRAAQHLARWQDKLGSIDAIADKGEKYFALRDLASEVDGLLHERTLSDLREELQPSFRKKVQAESGIGAGGVAAGAAIMVFGGPGAAIFIGVPMAYIALISVGSGIADHRRRKRSQKLYDANKELVDGLYVFQQRIVGAAEEILKDIETHPDAIAQSARCDDLLKINSLHDAFTEAAKARMRGNAQQPPPKPQGGFQL